MLSKRFSISKWMVFVIVISLLLLQFLRFPNNVLSWDVFGYYLYLPFTFIYNDPLLENSEVLIELWEKYHASDGLYQAYQVQSGNWMLRYTMGLAILKAPFFFLGHLAAYLGGWEMDGFSKPYGFFIYAGSSLYSILTFFLWRKILLMYYSERVTSITLFFIFFGTNLVIHLGCYGQSTMPHNYLLFLYTLLIFCTIRYYATFSKKYVVSIAVVAGILLLSRPSEMICLIIPLGWGVMSKASLLERWKLILVRKNHFFIVLGILLLIGSMQFVYWFVETGNPFFDSFTNPGEGMEFLHPFLIEMLLSYRKGWLLYTPIMCFSLLGLWVVWKEKKVFSWSIIWFCILTIYVVGSWSNYWYTESFSQRSMIPSYAIMSFAFAALMENVNRGFKMYVLYFLCIVFTFFNLFQSWQFDKGIISGNRMSREYYWSVFLQTNPPSDTQQRLLLRDISFVNGDIPLVNEKLTLTSTIVVDTNVLLSPVSRVKLVEKIRGEIIHSSYAWAKILLYIDSLPIYNGENILEVKMGNHGRSFAWRLHHVELRKLKRNANGAYEFYYLFPEIRNENRDALMVDVLNRSDKGFTIRACKVEIWEPEQDVHIF